MGAGFTLTWNANGVIEATDQAVLKGIHSVLADCVTAAQKTVPVKTGHLKNSIQLLAPGVKGELIEGAFGSWTVDYALWQEIGTRHMQGKYYLHNAAAKHYNSLPRRIQGYMKK